MILPERVFGSPGATTIRSGAAIGPMTCRTCSLSMPASSSGSEPSYSGVMITKAKIPVPLMSCGYPTTAASATAACATSALSTSAVPSRCPDTFSTSSTRPVIQ